MRHERASGAQTSTHTDVAREVAGGGTKWDKPYMMLRGHKTKENTQGRLVSQEK